MLCNVLNFEQCTLCWDIHETATADQGFSYWMRDNTHLHQLGDTQAFSSPGANAIAWVRK